MKMAAGSVFLIFASVFVSLTRTSNIRKCIHNCGGGHSSDRSSSTGDISITEEDIRRELLRLEGQRILEKLRLDRPPEIRVNLNDLPLPVTKRIEEQSGADEVAAEVPDDAPGRLKSIYVVGERPRRGRGRTHLCNDQEGKKAVCIDFELNGRSMFNHRLLTATLWLNVHLDEKDQYFDPDGERVSDKVPVNLSVSILHRHGHEELIVDATPVTATKSGHWLGVNVTEYMQREIDREIQRENREGRTRMHRITLAIGCIGLDPPPIAVSQNGSRRPFLDLQTQRPDIDQTDIRRKRSKLCGPGSTSESECCLETLFVNFTEIGWNSWILQPRGYETGYCKGRCQSTATRNYNAIMKAVLQRRQQQQSVTPTKLIPVDPEMAPCCSPLRMLPLEILYAKIENNHEQLSTAILPAMIVDSCRC